jgi:galactose mutarotase-like enzyme
MPASRAVFCVEPVSHVPDVVNRLGLPTWAT